MPICESVAHKKDPANHLAGLKEKHDDRSNSVFLISAYPRGFPSVMPTRFCSAMVATVRGTDTPVWFLLADDFQFYATVQFVQQFLLA